MASEDKRFYGWKLVIVLWFIILIGSSMMYGGIVINSHMARIINMPRGSFGLGQALNTLLVGLISPLSGLLVSKWGSRVTIILGMTMLTSGTFIMGAWVHGVLGYIIIYGIVMGTGLAFAGLVPIQTAITHWFRKKRALATSIVLTAPGVGALVFSTLFNRLIVVTGGNWQLAWHILALLAAFGTGLTVLAVKNKPSDGGQTSESIKIEDRPSRNRLQVNQTEKDWTIRQALRTKSYWFIMISGLGMSSGLCLCQAHGVIHLIDLGVSSETAAMSLGVLVFVSIIGRLLAGFLGDKIDLRWIIVLGLLSLFVGCLLVIRPVTIFRIYLYAVCVGVGFGLVCVTLFILMGNYYGGKHIAKLLGCLLPSITLFGALAVLSGGMIKDALGSYTIAFAAAGVIALIGAIIALFCTPPKVISA